MVEPRLDVHCLPKYRPIEAEETVRRWNEQDAADGVVGREWVAEHCERCGYEHLIRRRKSAINHAGGDDRG